MDVHGLLWHFRGLRWRLTLSYTLVTVLAVLALEVMVFAAFVRPGLGPVRRILNGQVIHAGLLIDAIVLTLVSAAMGTLFGYAWTHWLTGRLRLLADAVDAWGRGDLDVVARDASDDEIGRLARRLNHMAKQLRTLLETRQELAIVEERQRLARDLHDAVKQQVFATAMQLGAARAVVETDPAVADELLAEAERLVNQAQQELTYLLRELRPAALTGKGLSAALADAVDDWSRRTKVSAELRVQGERATPLAVEQALFRVAQEALANVDRHSGATKVDVRLSWAENTLTLAVSDNGNGFDVGRADGRGLGLSSMRERVEAIGGVLRVDSAPHGTQLEASANLH